MSLVSFVYFFYAYENLFLFYFEVPTIILMSIDLLDPQNAKKPKTYFQIFEFPAKTRVGKVRNISPRGPLDSWHQDLEFNRRMDIFGPLEPELK